MLGSLQLQTTVLLEMVIVVLPSPSHAPEAAANGLAGWGWGQAI